jgi:hypothetical protein
MPLSPDLVSDPEIRAARLLIAVNFHGARTALNHNGESDSFHNLALKCAFIVRKCPKMQASSSGGV